jgi:uncharacterized protein YecE (DUF72 family)
VSVHAWIGTSGFAFPEWKGNFYPEKLAAKDMLHYYAERFPTVEINNTFYQLPKENVLRGWTEQVPERFAFVLKASRFITHIRRLKDCAEPLQRIFGLSEHLGPRLGPLLFQLPPNLRKDVPLLARFLADRPDRRRVAVEFRHASWFDDEVFALLRDQGAALVVSDTGEEPVAPLVATTDWGYLRLRREEFSDRELQDWAQRIREQPWSEAFVFLKHEEEGRGPKLAAKLTTYFADEAAPAPATAAAPAKAKKPAAKKKATRA